MSSIKSHKPKKVTQKQAHKNSSFPYPIGLQTQQKHAIFRNTTAHMPIPIPETPHQTAIDGHLRHPRHRISSSIHGSAPWWRPYLAQDVGIGFQQGEGWGRFGSYLVKDVRGVVDAIGDGAAGEELGVRPEEE